jgi:hypothetical protein
LLPPTLIEQKVADLGPDHLAWRLTSMGQEFHGLDRKPASREPRLSATGAPIRGVPSIGEYGLPIQGLCRRVLIAEICDRPLVKVHQIVKSRRWLPELNIGAEI